MGFKLMAGAVASCALIGVAVGVGIIYGSLLISIGRNPSQRDELLRYAFIGFSLVEVSVKLKSNGTSDNGTFTYRYTLWIYSRNILYNTVDRTFSWRTGIRT